MTADKISPYFLDLAGQEIDELKEHLSRILHSGQLALGEYTRSFEQSFADYCGVKEAIAVSSGSAALEILLRIHRVEGKPIAVPTNTNFATVSAILRAGGIPVYLDMTPDSFMPDVDLLRPALDHFPIAGVVWVHIAGIMTHDFIEVVDFCRHHGIFLIEDAAHAHGSRILNKHAGTFGSAGAFSFFATKVMTTMEGGMIATDDDDIASLSRAFRNQGRTQRFGIENYHFGNTWRMTELSAALGSLQLQKLDTTLAKRAKAVTAFKEVLDGLAISYCESREADRVSNYKLIVKYDENASWQEMRERFSRAGVILGNGVYELPCHLQPVFANVARPPWELPVSEALCPKHVCPPIHSAMTEEMIGIVKRALRQCLGSRTTRSDLEESAGENTGAR